MSVTRITTLGVSQSILNSMTSTESDYYKLAEEASSGYKVTKISDDASSTKTLLNINSKLKELDDYISNMSTAQTELDTVDDTLSSLTDKIQSALDLATQASNGTYSDNDLANFKIQIDSIIQSVVDLSNTQYDGKYIFSGAATGTKTYTQSTGTGAGGSTVITNLTYNGTSSTGNYKRYVTISDGESVAINNTGDQVFGSYSAVLTTTVTTTGTSPDTTVTTTVSTSVTNATGILGTLMLISNALGAGESTTVGSYLTSLNSELETVSSVRTKSAAISNRFTSTEEAISTSITNLTSQRSDLRDADLSTVLSELAIKETALNASYNVFSTVSGMTLLDYL